MSILKKTKNDLKLGTKLTKQMDIKCLMFELDQAGQK
jgi:hypothetical protein